MKMVMSKRKQGWPQIWTIALTLAVMMFPTDSTVKIPQQRLLNASTTLEEFQGMSQAVKEVLDQYKSRLEYVNFRKPETTCLEFLIEVEAVLTEYRLIFIRRKRDSMLKLASRIAYFGENPECIDSHLTMVTTNLINLMRTNPSSRMKKVKRMRNALNNYLKHGQEWTDEMARDLNYFINLIGTSAEKIDQIVIDEEKSWNDMINSNLETIKNVCYLEYMGESFYTRLAWYWLKLTVSNDTTVSDENEIFKDLGNL